MIIRRQYPKKHLCSVGNQTQGPMHSRQALHHWTSPLASQNIILKHTWDTNKISPVQAHNMAFRYLPVYSVNEKMLSNHNVNLNDNNKNNPKLLYAWKNFKCAYKR
jgi:uncharacterized protein YprB with RNaseH-like and TPR domain